MKRKVTNEIDMSPIYLPVKIKPLDVEVRTFTNDKNETFEFHSCKCELVEVAENGSLECYSVRQFVVSPTCADALNKLLDDGNGYCSVVLTIRRYKGQFKLRLITVEEVE